MFVTNIVGINEIKKNISKDEFKFYQNTDCIVHCASFHSDRMLEMGIRVARRMYRKYLGQATTASFKISYMFTIHDRLLISFDAA
jgi:hypothetical protein